MPISQKPQGLRAGVGRYVVLGVILAGLGLALYLTYIHYRLYGRPEYGGLICDVSSVLDCAYVLASPWAEVNVAGRPIPVAGLAAGLFFALLMLQICFRGKSAAAWLVGTLLSVAGLAVALGYLAIMVVVLRRGCLLCLTLDGFIAATAGTYLWNGRGRGGWRAVAFRQMTGVALLAGVSWSVAVGVVWLVLDRAVRANVPHMIAAIRDVKPEVLPFDGPPTKVLTLYVFTDLKCPACRDGFTTIQKLHQIYGANLRIVYKNFPLDNSCNNAVRHNEHPGSCAAARVALAAQALGRYEEVASRILAAWPNADGVVRQLGADGGLAAGMEQADALLRQDIRDGVSASIKRMPTYFLGGRRIEGPQPLPVWTAVIDSLLKQKSGTTDAPQVR